MKPVNNSQENLDVSPALNGINYCAIERVVPAKWTMEGAGVKLRRSLGSQALPDLDPFLLLDEFISDDPNDYISGFPDHPHRGFETVTYMIAGNMHHRDSRGNQGDIGAGDIQWMTAGRGIIHSEMPRQESGLMWGFQLWVNLAARDKMKEPSYQNIISADIPEVELDSGTRIRVIAGESYGIEGAVKGIAVQPLYLDVFLPGKNIFTHPIPAAHQSLVYVFEGQGEFIERADSTANEEKGVRLDNWVFCKNTQLSSLTPLIFTKCSLE